MVTALDPAGPLYSIIGKGEKLDITDADFILVIHTNMDGFGGKETGHVNFFPNGGITQPGCSTSQIMQKPHWLLSELGKHVKRPQTKNKPLYLYFSFFSFMQPLAFVSILCRICY